MRIWVIHRLKPAESEHVMNWIRLQSGGGETLNPADLGLKTIEYFNANAITRFGGTGHGSSGILVGSFYAVLGTADNTGVMSGNSKTIGGKGSGVLLTWMRTSGSGAFAGTSMSGTRTACAEVIGKM